MFSEGAVFVAADGNLPRPELDDEVIKDLGWPGQPLAIHLAYIRISTMSRFH